MNLTGPRVITPIRSIIVSVVVFVLFMIFFPTAVFEASKAGVSAWWNIVFPALLPFFISSELLMSYGIISFMGVVLEPIMRPVFNLPGVASFVMAVGFTSGFPISASLAARLRSQKLCTRFEAERLMCFTNNSSPLFMLTAVGVGMFNNARLGLIIALSHYAANLLLGLGLRFYKRNDPERKTSVIYHSNLFERAMAEMRKTVRANPAPFSKMLSDAITSSINKLLVIGGFVIIFSILIKVSVISGFMTLISNSIGYITMPLGFTKSAIESLGYGFFEITLGTKAAAEATAPIIQRVIAASVILAWSGLSVLAQISAMISGTDLKMGLFITCRFLQCIFAGLFCYVLLASASIRSWLAKPLSAGSLGPDTIIWVSSFTYFSKLCLYAVAAWLFLGLIVYLIRSFSLIRLKV